MEIILECTNEVEDKLYLVSGVDERLIVVI